MIEMMHFECSEGNLNILGSLKNVFGETISFP